VNALCAAHAALAALSEAGFMMFHDTDGAAEYFGAIGETEAHEEAWGNIIEVLGADPLPQLLGEQLAASMAGERALHLALAAMRKLSVLQTFTNAAAELCSAVTPYAAPKRVFLPKPSPKAGTPGPAPAKEGVLAAAAAAAALAYQAHATLLER
jgi:hypothetical protein